jgi:hypothetical protein
LSITKLSNSEGINLLAFLIYSLLGYDKLVLIDHKDISNVDR